MKKIATIIHETIPAITAEGFRPEPEWKQFVMDAVCEASGFEIDCPESEDSSVSLTFEDGSAVRIDNPKHLCFCGQVS